MTQDEIDDQKKIEFYAASVAAWYESSLEHDKSLLTLSAGGIGLLITLLTTVGLGTSEALVLYIGAICSFVVSLVSILFVFRGNQRHIEDILSSKNQGADLMLSKLDGTAIWSFGIGVVFTAVIGISAAIHSFTTKEKIMTNETTKTTETVPLRESFNGAANLQSGTDLGKSFNGAGNLQPQPATQTTTPSTTPASSGTSQNQGVSGKQSMGSGLAIKQIQN